MLVIWLLYGYPVIIIWLLLYGYPMVIIWFLYGYPMVSKMISLFTLVEAIPNPG